MDNESVILTSQPGFGRFDRSRKSSHCEKITRNEEGHRNKALGVRLWIRQKDSAKMALVKSSLTAQAAKDHNRALSSIA